MTVRTAVAATWVILIATAWESDVEEARQAIVGGQIAAERQWPTAVSLGRCDGVLIHPRLVATAAHCLIGGGPRAIVLGNERWRPTRTVPVERCVRHPDHGRIEAADVGFCVLAEEVAGLSIVPALSAREAGEHLHPGATAVLVGFGNVAAGQSGGGVGSSVAVWRLLPDGEPDRYFGRSGLTIVPVFESSDPLAGFTLLPDGRIVIAVNTDTGDIDSPRSKPFLLRLLVLGLRLRAEGNGAEYAGIARIWD